MILFDTVDLNASLWIILCVLGGTINDDVQITDYIYSGILRAEGSSMAEAVDSYADSLKDAYKSELLELYLEINIGDVNVDLWGRDSHDVSITVTGSSDEIDIDDLRKLCAQLLNPICVTGIIPRKSPPFILIFISVNPNS